MPGHARLTLTGVFTGAAVWLAAIGHPHAVSAQASAGGGQTSTGSTTNTPAGGFNAPGGPVTTGETATAAITGVVTDAATGAPIADAVVMLARASGSIRTQTRQATDAKGRFGFVNLPPSADYTVSASHTRYADSSYGRDIGTVSSRPIALVDGQWLDGVKIAMWPAGAISGVVTDERGEPVAGTFVRLLAQIQVAGHAQLATGPLTTTDDRGAYRIGSLMPGKYLVQVPSVQAAAPSTMNGLALAGYTSQAAAAAEAAGRTLRPELGVTGDPLAQLVVGRYVTPPAPQNGRWMAYPVTYFPDAHAVSEALTVELRPGESRSSADIRLTPVATARIAGRVQGPAEAISQLTLRLIPAGLEDLGAGSEAATTLVGPDGRFVFLGVPAGTYTIDAPYSTNEFSVARFAFGQGPSLPRPPGGIGSGSSSSSVESAGPGVSFVSQTNRSAGAGYGARVPLVVDGRDRDDVSVPVRPLGSMTGVFVLDLDPRTPDTPAPAYLAAQLEPASGYARFGVVRSIPNGNLPREQFAAVGLQPGAYLLRANVPRPWIVKSISWNGKDYTHLAFDASSGGEFADVTLTLTTRAATIAGTARDERGLPSETAAIIAFPVDAAGWTDYGLTPTRIKAVLSGQAGQFKLTSLPAGDYNVIAVDADQIEAWHDPAFLSRAAGAALRVRVDWGETATQDIRVRAIK
jgi:hypothetical protein